MNSWNVYSKLCELSLQVRHIFFAGRTLAGKCRTQTSLSHALSWIAWGAISFLFIQQIQASETTPLHARDIGVAPGILEPGPLNAITDVGGVEVGHFTLIEERMINTGATVILPHRGNLRQRPVRAAVVVGNGYGKIAGVTQIRELGKIETPILLTNTLNVAEGIAALVQWTLDQPGNENVRSVNAVVGETNDGFLNDIRGRHLTTAMMRQAIDSVSAGPVEEGSIGAGTGTVAFGWKGGIGTSSRKLPESLGDWTVGVLVQSNFGGSLNIDGLRIGEMLGQFYLRDKIDGEDLVDGSIMIVVATDAPLSSRNLERLGRRALFGLARTGATMSNGSGDYVILFSTHVDVRGSDLSAPQSVQDLPDRSMSPLFQAVADATEEAILNSMFMAQPVVGYRGSVDALPVEHVRELIEDIRTATK